MPYLLNQTQTITLNLDPSQEIGSGGMGVVYRIGNIMGNGNLVAKIFKNPADPKNPSRAKLQAMIDNPPEHIYEVINGVGYTQFAWVQYLIFEDSGQLIGYAMPELDFDRSLSLNPFMYPREATRLTDYQNSLNYRVQLGANISALMADLHAHGHAFIDFKEQNLRLLPEPKTGLNDDFKGFIVGFVDCDSFRVTGRDGTVYPSPVISPEMTSPEYHEHKDISRLDEKHDRFVLAIELFKILNYGIHPFYFIPLSERLKNATHRNTDQFIKEGLYAYGVTPHPEIAPLKNSIHQCWDDVTRAMFDQAFLCQNPADRPTAQQWEDHFRRLLTERDFVVCENFPNEISHIHFAGKLCHRCLWLNAQQNATNITTHTTTANPQNPNTLWQNPPTQNNSANQVNNSPWATISAKQTASPVVEAVNKTENKTGSETFTNPATPTPAQTDFNQNKVHSPEPNNSPELTNSLEQNRQWEQSLNTNRQAAIAEPIVEQNSNSTQEPINTQVTTNQPQDFHQASTNTKPKKSGKFWLISMIAGIVGIGGYVLTQQKPKSMSATNQNDNSATATADGDSSTTSNPNRSAYQQAINDLPKVKSEMTKELAKQDKGGLFGSSADGLYQDTLGLSPEFLSAVKQTAKQGEPDLAKLITIANTHDSEATKNAALTAFRGADMGYFAKQKVNKNLAKQFNESAKNYYWNKKDPKSALYLQTQAVKNSPNQGEYVANLAFYLVKNNYPNAKDFVMYALQTPRDASKFPNTYMIELASALAVKENDDKSAVGALLTQYYTADDRAKRCQNMLKYPQTYPELVPIAEKVLTVIDEQNSSGETAPNVCLPPFQWVN